MPKDNFSILWTGRFVPQQTGLYKFVLNSDDGSRLYLDGKLIIDNWGGHAPIEKWGQMQLKKGKEVSLKIEYNETGNTGLVMFGWTCQQEETATEAIIKAVVTDDKGNTVAQAEEKISANNNQRLENVLKMHIDKPHLWSGRKDPYLYTLDVRVEDSQGQLLDRLQQPLGLRYFEVDRDKGLILNGQPYHLHGVCRHQEWQGLGPALTDANHEQDIAFILEVGANGVRLAHYQQAEKIYSLCDEKGLVVWAEIPNTPMYRAENPAYVQNCKDQLTELVKQNYNHPSILFWGMYNEIPISADNVKTLHETAKGLDPARLTTQADFAQPTERHFVTDVAAWNWYFGWYYDNFDKYETWYNNLHEKFPQIKGGLSEYGADGCVTQQQDPPTRPADPTYGKFYPEQYQRLYHEEAWKRLKDRDDIWCKFIWNMFDFSWTPANRGDRPYMNHKGLMTHDRKVKKDSFYFYKANWSDEPVLYILSRRNTQRTESSVEVSVYTNLEQVELSVNGKLISSKPMDSDIHKITWEDIKLQPGRNQINVSSSKGDVKYTDACEWTYQESKR
jgi:beta-galactosidase